MPKTGRRGAGRGGWTRARAAAAACLALALTGACRDRAVQEEPGRSAMADSAGAAAAAPEVLLGAPPELGWNQEDTLVVTLVNGTARPLADAVVNLFVAAPLEVVVDSAAVRSSNSARPPEVLSSGEGTRVVFAAGALAPGARGEFRQAVRTPPAPVPAAGRPAPAAAAPPAYVVRAWAEAPAGTPLGAPVQDTLRIRPGSEAVAGGCATTRDAPVGRYGIGPVRLGMSAAALRAACPEARDTAWQGEEGMRERGLVVRLAGAPVVAVLAQDTVRRILVDRPALRTAAGVGVGSTLAELRARYGAICAGRGERGRIAVWFPNAPGVGFGLDTVAPLPEAADSIPEDTRVISLWMHQGASGCPPPRPVP